MTGKKLLIGLGVVVVLGALAYVNIVYRTTDTVPVTAESITRRDLQAIVSASGKIQPKHQVNVSAETMGKVVGLMVAEGDTVTKGQPLLQIDPRNLRDDRPEPRSEPRHGAVAARPDPVAGREHEGGAEAVAGHAPAAGRAVQAGACCLATSTSAPRTT